MYYCNMDNKTEQFTDVEYSKLDAEYENVIQQRDKYYRRMKELESYCSRGDKELRDVKVKLYDLVVDKSQPSFAYVAVTIMLCVIIGTLIGGTITHLIWK